jgi:hypothetical protein
MKPVIALTVALVVSALDASAGQNCQQVRITPAFEGPADVLVLPLETKSTSGKTQLAHTTRKGYSSASQWQFEVTPSGENSWKVSLLYFRLADSNSMTAASTCSYEFTVDRDVQRVNCGWAAIEIERFVH